MAKNYFELIFIVFYKFYEIECSHDVNIKGREMKLVVKLTVSVAAVVALGADSYAASAKKNVKQKVDSNVAEVTKEKKDTDTAIEVPKKEEQVDSTVTIPPEKMKSGVDLYNAGKFLEAYKVFDELMSIKGDDARINFYFGRCATELKMYDDALLAFERVLIVDPNHVRSIVEIGRIYFEEKSFDNAEAEFNKALEYQIPNEVRAQINLFLKAIEDSKKKHFIGGAFIFGFGLDTNVKNDTGEKTYTTGIGVTPGKDPVYDYSLSETLALNHTYKFSKSDWSLSNSLVLFNQHYRQTIDSNVLFSQIGSGLSYGSKSYNFSITPTLENLKYGRTHSPSLDDGFGRIGTIFSQLFTIDRLVDTMTAVGVGQKFSMPFMQTYSFEQSLNIKKQYFKKHTGKQSTGNLDANAFDLSVGIKKDMSNGRIISGTFMIGKNIKNDGGTVGPNVDYVAKSFKLEYSTPVLKYFDLSVNALIKKQDYGDPDMFNYPTGLERSDIVKSYGISASKPLGSIIFGASFNRTYSDSNYGASVYQKNNVGVSLTKAF